VTAQTRSPAVIELSSGVAGAWSRRDFYAAEAGVGRRIGQGRLALTAAAGRLGGYWGCRLEARGQFVVLPFARQGVGAYGGLGAAWVGGDGVSGAAYLTALLGVERAPGKPRGWYVEMGLGGGVRLAAGMRWRAFPAWWPE
jgi:hypothetical protein